MESTQEKVVYTISNVEVEIANNGFFHFEGSRESIYLGKECDFKVGDKIKITFERMPNAKENP